MSTVFPADFADLEPFAAWAVPTETARYAKRIASTMDELQAFYDAAFPRLDDALAYCDRFELDALPDDATRLLELLCSLALVSYPIEVWKQPLPVDVGSARIDRIDEPRP